MTSHIQMKINRHRLSTVSHSSGKQKSVSLEKQRVFVRADGDGGILLFIFSYLYFQLNASVPPSSEEKVIICASVSLDVCFRSVDLPVVCVFLPVGQSVE